MCAKWLSGSGEFTLGSRVSGRISSATNISMIRTCSQMRTGLDRKFWNAIEKIKHVFSLGAKHNVCNGPATRFWLDWWQGRGPLRDRFLGLFAIVADPEATVAEIFQDNTFRVTFCRELGFGERVEWDNLSRLVEGLTLSEPRDLISWSLEPSGSFSVRSLYKRMCEGIPISTSESCGGSMPHSKCASSSGNWPRRGYSPMKTFGSVGPFQWVLCLVWGGGRQHPHFLLRPTDHIHVKRC
jgi:hypothetical protein